MKIVLFGQRRNGTTMAFKLFRSISELRCYYEPFHPKLINHPQWTGVTEVDIDTKSVYAEFKKLGESLNTHFEPLGAPVFPIEQEIEEAAWSPHHTNYLKYLFDSSQKVLIQPVRANYHLKNIYAAFPDAKFIWIVRNPEGVVSSLVKKDPAIFEIKERSRQVSFFLRKAGIKSSGGNWSQDLVFQHLLKANSQYARFKRHPFWFKLMLTCYDSVKAVEAFREVIPPNRLAVIRYEDVCLNPNSIMHRLCEWLGLEFPQINFAEIAKKASPVVNSADKRWQWAISEFEMIHQENNASWNFPVQTRIGN